MNVNIFSIIERVKEIEKVNTDTAVAKVLNMSRENLNGYKSKGTIPYEALVVFASKKRLTLDFIFLGKEVKVTAEPNKEEGGNDSMEGWKRYAERLEKDLAKAEAEISRLSEGVIKKSNSGMQM